MNKRLKSIVDLEKYPIYDLNSPIIKNLIKRCKEELDQYSCSTISNFLNTLIKSFKFFVDKELYVLGSLIITLTISLLK